MQNAVMKAGILQFESNMFSHNKIITHYDDSPK